jgi:hypothetical protein
MGSIDRTEYKTNNGKDPDLEFWMDSDPTILEMLNTSVSKVIFSRQF